MSFLIVVDSYAYMVSSSALAAVCTIDCAIEIVLITLHSMTADILFNVRRCLFSIKPFRH